MIETLKQLIWLNNSAYDYIRSFLVFFALIVILKIFQAVVLARLRVLAKKTKTDFDDVLINIFSSIKPPFYFFIALFFGVKVIDLNSAGDIAVRALFMIVIVYEVIKSLEKLVGYFVEKYIAKMAEDGLDEGEDQTKSMVKVAQVVIRVVLWLLGITLVLSNLGINVTSIVASLGIGGIAIAFALQNILGDIFSSFSIYVDKPFKVGDFIKVGSDLGVVEKIGLKTTRMRTLQGEELVVSNTELTTARIQNFRKLETRRSVFNIGVTYNTKAEKLEEIPKMLEGIIDNVEGATFDRCFFQEFGPSSLDFEIVFYVDSSDYEDYVRVRQKINLDLVKRFEAEKIEFAYPTQTVYVNKLK